MIRLRDERRQCYDCGISQDEDTLFYCQECKTTDESRKFFCNQCGPPSHRWLSHECKRNSKNIKRANSTKNSVGCNINDNLCGNEHGMNQEKKNDKNINPSTNVIGMDRGYDVGIEVKTIENIFKTDANTHEEKKDIDEFKDGSIQSDVSDVSYMWICTLFIQYFVFVRT